VVTRFSSSTARPVKIVYFTESLVPLVDGVSRTLGQLFRFLETLEMDFRIVSPFHPDDGVPWSHRVWDVPFVRFPWYPDYRISFPPRGLTARLDEYGPDMLHVVSPTPMAVWAQRWARRRGIPVVASFHTHFISYFRYYGIPALERIGWRGLARFYRRCERVYAPTHRIMAELREQGIPNVELWSRGIDVSRFNPEFRDPALRAAVDADRETPVLLLVSRLVKEKDLLDLVPLNRILQERGIRFRMVFVGDGPLRGELEMALPHARFAGHLEGEELARWYASADVFVFPSTTETFGNVVAEAQASGLPVVVVDRGGPPELVNHGTTGLIARANAPDDLADKVARLLTSPAERTRIGKAAREAAGQRDWRMINHGLLDSYRQVAASAGRSSAG
jgi:phosphatidylinositol alpha 1,6-mannosyltransferase